MATHARAAPRPRRARAPTHRRRRRRGRPRRGRPSERVPLTRERIVDAAVSFIDDHGLPGLSMRRLGTLLGVEAMSLYRYVPGREQLLDAVVERIVDEMDADPDVLARPEHGWQDYLQRLAHGIRRVALDASEGVPPGRVPTRGGTVAAAAAAEPALGRGVPRGARERRVQRPRDRRGLPRLHQLPARPPAARGRRTRRGPRSPRRDRRGRGQVPGAVPERPPARGPAARGPLRGRVRGLPGEPAATPRADPHRNMTGWPRAVDTAG